MQYRPELQPSGLNAPAHGNLRDIEASELSPGHRLLLPDGETTAQVLEVDPVLDDYSSPALYFVALDNNTNLRVAHGTDVSIVVSKPSRPADLLFAGPTAAGSLGSSGNPSNSSADAEDGTSGPTPQGPAPQGPAHDPAHALDLEPDDEPTDDFARPSWDKVAPNSSFAETDTFAGSDTFAGGDIAPPDDPSHLGYLSTPQMPEAPRSPEVAERQMTTITLDTGDVVVVPGKARPDASGQSATLLRLIPTLEGHPEDLIRHIDAVHPGRNAVHQLAERLAKGINTKSGACLQDLRDLAYELFVGQNDTDNALKVADLLAVVPYDGNPGRWSSVESGLALAAHLTRERSEDERARAYAELLRAPETAETDRFRAQMAARVRQRTLNEPNLYDKEVSRAADAGDDSEERSWRVLRLATLLHLRAHGGSEVFDDAELDRRIRIELGAVGR